MFSDNSQRNHDPVEGVPEGGVPFICIPDGGVPEGWVPFISLPGEDVPEGCVPFAGIPDGEVPDADAPAGSPDTDMFCSVGTELPDEDCVTADPELWVQPAASIPAIRIPETNNKSTLLFFIGFFSRF